MLWQACPHGSKAHTTGALTALGLRRISDVQVDEGFLVVILGTILEVDQFTCYYLILILGVQIGTIVK